MNKALEAAAWLVLLVLVGAVVAGGYLVWRVVETTLAAIPAVAWLATGGAALFAFILVVVGGAFYIVKALAARSRRIYARDGLYPVVDHGNGRYANLNEPGAQSLAVLAAGRRPTAALAGRVIDGQYRNMQAAPEPLPALAEPALTVQDVTAVNPRTAPHWLLIGTTGSGKTSASYAILSELARRAPCEFVITEPGGVNWGAQTTATNTADIAQAIIGVQREMERRQEILRRWDVDHVQDLAEPLPYLVLVTEETDAVLDDLRLTDRETRTETVVALRAIARMGRKAGVCLMAVSQSGTTDVFDSHVRKNLSNVLLFRSEHTVSEMWRLPGVRLADLAPGAAYSVRHGGLVQFPHVARPQLAAPGDGIPVNNWPVASGSEGVVSVVDGSEGVVQRLAPGREPDAQLAEQLRQMHADGWSKTALCNAAWGYKDGAVWQILDSVLRGDL